MNWSEGELWNQLEGNSKDKNSLAPPLQSPCEGISKKPTGATIENKRKHLNIHQAQRARSQKYQPLSPYVLSLSWPISRRVRNSRAGEELVNKRKPTTSPLHTTGSQTQRSTELGRERVMFPVNRKFKFLIFHWVRQLNYWNKTALLI